MRILIGFDGSHPSANALHWATSLAKSTKGTITAATAWNDPTLFMPPLAAPVIAANKIGTRARRELTAAVAASNATEITEERAIMGPARTVLTDLSEHHDLLVVGRTGRSRMQRLLLGSTASHCARHARCPVVIAQSPRVEASITVAVDGSPSSIEALVWAMRLGPEQTILAVYSHDEWELDELALDDNVRQQLDDKADHMLAEVVEKALDRTGTDPDRVLRQIRQGDPRATVVDLASPGELLVLGAHGHSGLSRWMMGSLADYAITHARGSVAIWR